MNTDAVPRSLCNAVAGVCFFLLLLTLLLMFFWDTEPDSFDVISRAQDRNQGSTRFVTGYVTTSTMINFTDTLLSKRGGYLGNDIMPPGVLMDNYP